MSSLIQQWGWEKVRTAPDWPSRLSEVAGFVGRFVRWFITPPRRLRMTRMGGFFILILFLVGFAAVNTGNNLLYLIVGMMLGMIAVSGILSEAALGRLQAAPRLPPTLHAGRYNRIGAKVSNGRRYASAYSVSIRLHSQPEAEATGYLLRIGAGRTVEASFSAEFPARGLYRFEKIKLTTEFPFGLIRKWRLVDWEREAVVYPRVYPLPHKALSYFDRALDRSDQKKRIVSGEGKGEGSELRNIRDYRPGDPIKAISWKSSARLQKTMSREFQDERSGRVLLALRPARPLAAIPEEEIERAVSLVASVCSAYLDRGLAVGLWTPAFELKSDRGIAHHRRILEKLALTDLAPPTENPPPPAPGDAIAISVPLSEELKRWAPDDDPGDDDASA